MKNIIDAIMDIQEKSMWINLFKLEYTIDTEILKQCIFCSDEDRSLGCENEMENKINNLIESGEDLILNLKEFINYVELLNSELKNYQEGSD